MQVIAEFEAAHRTTLQARQQGGRIGLVPTMGALHEGHLSLVEASRAECDFTIATIFVNPTQFGPHEDFTKYPRTMDADLAMLRERGVDLVFTPSNERMYPPGHTTFVEPPAVAAPFEGVLRPGHFRGVTTIVLKLFQILPADIAFFGQKDYQQTLVVRRMVEDLNTQIAIRVCPIVRERDGLAMSSRNRYLAAEERERAAALYGSLMLASGLISSGERRRENILDAMREHLHTRGVTHIDYIALADPETLEERNEMQLPVIVLIAARVGSTRLIDNLLLPAPQGTWMLQTLFRIPHQIGPLPIFGMGWLVIIWAIATLVIVVRAVQSGQKKSAIMEHVIFMLITGVVLGFVLPRVEEKHPVTGEILGLPVRGYGMMMLLGVVSGVGLAAYRAWRMNLDPEVIYGLAFWMFVAGLAGARLFYVIEYWKLFRRKQIWHTILEIVNYTQGGLVVYGSVIGALLALLVYSRYRKLPLFALLDLISPSLVIGLAFGRIGCLLNGCCYGGICETDLPKQRFPIGSPPYVDQLQQGSLLGMKLHKDQRTGELVVVDVVPGGLAAAQGVRKGDRFEKLVIPEQVIWEEARRNPKRDKEDVVFARKPPGDLLRFPLSALPRMSQPVHPTQISSSLDAALLFLLLWFLYPFRRFDGAIFALLMTLHPISRFFIEIIRSDEPTQWGTHFTISQWISIAILAAVMLLWVYLLRTRPAPTHDFARVESG